MATTLKPLYANSVALTCTLASLATSATFASGRESDQFVNTAGLYDDVLLAGNITVGTSPTANTQILINIASPRDTTPTWPSTMAGADANRTITSAGVARSFLKLAAQMEVDTTTSNRMYFFGPISVAQLFGGTLPPRFSVFVAQNTGQNLNSAGASHSIYATGVQWQNV